MKKQQDDKFTEQLTLFYKRNIEAIRSFSLTRLRKGFEHENIISHGTYAPWKTDNDFSLSYEQIKNYTLVDNYRCYEQWDLVRRNGHIEGDILEVGVWKGGTGVLLAKAAETKNSNCRVYLIDTFSGVVKATEDDTIYEGGEHDDTSQEAVLELIEQQNLKNVTLLKGIFPDEVNLDEIPDVKLKLCHIDVDTYQSAKDVFHSAWKLVVKGGVIVFDDYGFWGCEGVTKFVNELNLKNAIFVYNLNGHALIIKTK